MFAEGTGGTIFLLGINSSLTRNLPKAGSFAGTRQLITEEQCCQVAAVTATFLKCGSF
jgi:hypothetical protein